MSQEEARSRCYARCPKNGTRCRLEAGHEAFEPSKNEALNHLNGWHRVTAGVWKDGERFLTWRQYDRLCEEVRRGQEEDSAARA